MQSCCAAVDLAFALCQLACLGTVAASAYQVKWSSAIKIVSWRTQTKTYHMVDDEEEMLQRAEGTDIQWASGKNPTVKVGI